MDQQIERPVADILVEHVSTAIAAAYHNRSKLPAPILALKGMSSSKGRHLLNNLCALSPLRYLEIGCWQGSTLISALYGNAAQYHLAIDNFSEDPEGAKAALLQNCTTHLQEEPYEGDINLVDADALCLNPETLGASNINVFFYDGCHTRHATNQALLRYFPSLASAFILVMDDWNWGHVRDATVQTLAMLPISIRFSALLSNLPGLAPALDQFSDKPLNPLTGMPVGHVVTVYPDGWWNGMAVFVCQKL
jgi:hypothetical protein